MITVSGHPAEPPCLALFGGRRLFLGGTCYPEEIPSPNLADADRTDIPPAEAAKTGLRIPRSALLPYHPAGKPTGARETWDRKGNPHSDEVRGFAQAVMYRKRGTRRANRAPPAHRKVPASDRLFQQSRKSKVARISPSPTLPNLIWRFNTSLKRNSA